MLLAVTICADVPDCLKSQKAYMKFMQLVYQMVFAYGRCETNDPVVESLFLPVP